MIEHQLQQLARAFAHDPTQDVAERLVRIIERVPNVRRIKTRYRLRIDCGVCLVLWYGRLTNGVSYAVSTCLRCASVVPPSPRPSTGHTCQTFIVVADVQERRPPWRSRGT